MYCKTRPELARREMHVRPDRGGREVLIEHPQPAMQEHISLFGDCKPAAAEVAESGVMEGLIGSHDPAVGHALARVRACNDDR